MRILESLVTSAAGDKLASKTPQLQGEAPASRATVSVDPEHVRHTITGIGSSFTESSAFVLAHLEPEDWAEVMRQIFGAQGANFTLARTHIGACDFCVDGKYSYAPLPNDVSLSAFSIDCDSTGFDRSRFPGILDASFDLLPMIQEANAVKAAQGDAPVAIVASAWTAPPWMKGIEDWYHLPAKENGYQGWGGSLKPEHQQTYADYLVRYLDAYREKGVEFWGLTPVNEPNGNNGQWESMHFSPESQRDFIMNHLGPTLARSQHAATRLLIYDQNRDDLERWTDTILGDPDASPYVYGTAVHWYDSTIKVLEQEIAAVREKFPDFDILHTEGCIDDLGKPAPGGVLDPEGFQESGWFGNDSFWWGVNATDWAYTATWAPNVEDHPMYCPVHRYARDMIVGIDHGLSGWIDWNIVLDAQGGPNHVGNFCGAPIMIDRESREVYYTPVFYVLAQLSRTIRPGDQVLGVSRVLDGLEADDLHACATLSAEGVITIQMLNTTQAAIPFDLKVGEYVAAAEVPANAVQTLRLVP